MNTFAEQRDFFVGKWNEGMRQAAESAGASGIRTFVETHDDPLQRRVLYVFARQMLVLGDWAGRDLDVYAEVARAGIEECLRQAESESDPEVAARRTDTANIISYNLAADLADCWPNADLPREQRHFELGLAAAADCVRWREELDKPPGPRSMAFWAKGIHELRLGRSQEARDSFESSASYALEAADGDTMAFGVLLARGFAALAMWAGGDGQGRSEYDSALGDFRAQLDEDSTKDDAQFGIDQLETARHNQRLDA